MLKNKLVTTSGIILTGTLLTFLVLYESIFPPWAPFFIVYAILAFAIPISLKTYKFGSFGKVMSAGWKLMLAIVIVDLIWDPGVLGFLYGKFLDNLGLASNPYYSVEAASDSLFAKITRSFNISSTEAQIFFSFFIMIWAPFGEEFFYRGYMYGGLRKSHAIFSASLISAAFFGIRHATHFFYLTPDVPYVSAFIWALSAFVAGLMLNYLYEKTGSLYPCIAAHLLINSVWILNII